MNDLAPHELLRKPMDGESYEPREIMPRPPRRWGGRLLALATFMTLAGALALGASRYLEQQRQVLATAEQSRDFVPSVRVATVRGGDPISLVSLPATTSAFATANINARASGYIDKRYVDIGDRVKKAQLLADITAPELDHQIAQAEATLGQNKAAVQQVQANLDLARVTWGRDKPLVEKGWATQQQGTIDVQNIKALEANLAVAESNVVAQQAQVDVLNQQKSYQRVAAPFDGVITQRNVDVGTLVQADAVSGTFMFTLMQSKVIRTQVFVPQDQAFGLEPGVEAVVRVPEIPDRTFPGKVTRIADALQPGTRTLLTEIDVPNPDGALAVGIYCTVELHIPRKTPSLLVPSEALIFNRDGPQVAVVENGIVHIRKVSVTRDLGTSLELNDGVKAGDKVVLNPPVNLVEGNQVRASG
jgi:RND family efflux transporter MFP subunit